MSIINVDSISDAAGTGSPSFPNGISGNGSALTSLTSANLTGALPAIDGSALTSLTSANLTGALPAIDGSALTGVGGETYDIQTFITSGTWTRPTGFLATDEVWVWCLSGGGGGAQDDLGYQAVGGFGGLGVYLRLDMDSLASTQAIVIGAGGAGRNSGTDGDGTAGGDSTFGLTGTYGYIGCAGGSAGVQNDGIPAAMFLTLYNPATSANDAISLARTQNPFYGYSADGLAAGSNVATTIYGGGAGGSGQPSGSRAGGISMWGGRGGFSEADGNARRNGGFPAGGGGSNDRNDGAAGDGAAGIVVVHTKRTVL